MDFFGWTEKADDYGIESEFLLGWDGDFICFFNGIFDGMNADLDL